jgi:peptidoglycan/xylan/chitin deacetylase (PgdA/CDA1 family)
VSERSRTDELRSARLLLGPDAPDRPGQPGAEVDRLGAEALKVRAVRRAVRSRRPPSRPARFAQRVRRKLGRLDYERAVAEPLLTARRAVLGEGASGPPRFLVRVDEFPHYLAWDDPTRYGTERYRRFHAIMAGAGVPYLIAVPPRVSHLPLDPHETRWRALEDDERALLERLRDEGVAFALHGLDHRTRFASPRRHSELSGLGRDATEALLDDGLAELAALGIAPEVFVPPYNRFDAAQYELLARRFAVVCGGPESIGLMGFQRTPLWRGEAVYLPSYEPLYGHAREVLPAARRLIERDARLWAPIVLHWGWEGDEDWVALERLLAAIAPCAARWEDFLAAARASGAAHG